MAKKDEIFKSFLKHEILSEKYKIASEDIPNTVREGLNSSIPIIKSIALIVENLESSQPATDTTLRNIITQYLNEAAI